MNKYEILSHKEQRKQLWIDVWVNVAGSANCSTKTIPTKWADDALEQFDQRFPQPKKETENDNTN